MSKGAIDIGHRGQPPGEEGGWKREREDLGGQTENILYYFLPRYASFLSGSQFCSSVKWENHSTYCALRME